MSKYLIVIESPNKINSYRKYLGSDYDIVATKGHVMDLPPNKIGVNTRNKSFDMTYETLNGKKAILEDISKKAKNSDIVYLMTDPDREGSGIAACVYRSLPANLKAKCKRASTSAITKPAILAAIQNAGEIDNNMVAAFEARRVTDRLVGYKVSPIMWSKGLVGASAGRVQSVALKYVVDRDREIETFVPEEYWDIDASMPGFKPRFWGLDGIGKTIRNEKTAQALKKMLMGGCKKLRVASIEKKTRRREAAPPFITSSLQQAANSIFGWPVDKTMQVAQKIFEKGCITYHRTDSVDIDKEKLSSLRNFLASKYGQTYVSDSINTHKSKKASQEAHEAIRPTEEDVTGLNGDELKLYNLIRDRYLASQMADAVFDQVKIEFVSIDTKMIANFSINGSKLIFDGFLKVHGSTTADVILPDLKVGDEVAFTNIEMNQKFTQTPSRYSDASLVKRMETDGVGRPATYASTIKTLLDRKFVIKEGKTFRATDLGFVVNDYLAKFFPHLVDPSFTAEMENQLDDVAAGKISYVDSMNAFYDPFKTSLQTASEGDAKDIFKTSYLCPSCKVGYLLKKPDKEGKWWYPCSRYPECKTVALTDLKSGDLLVKNGKIQVKESPPEIPIAEGTEVPNCPTCEGEMKLRTGKFGSFWGCVSYKTGCKGTLPYEDPNKPQEKAEEVTFKGLECPECETLLIKTAGKFGEYMKCPKQGCKGSAPVPVGRCPTCNNWAVSRYSKKKKSTFYCCVNWSNKCDFVTSNLKDVKSI